MQSIVLGSSSKRRIEILSHYKLDFTAASPPFDEASVSKAQDPASYVKKIALGKANSLREAYPDALIITGDTTVFHNEKFYNKPKTRDEGVEMLLDFSGKDQKVYSSLCVQSPHTHYLEADVTTLYFNPLTKGEAIAYCERFNPTEYAGAYAIQEGEGLLIRRIEGSYLNIVGMPVHLLREGLKTFGIDLWDSLNA